MQQGLELPGGLAGKKSVCSERDLPLVSSQVFIGIAVSILCGLALRHDQWFVHRTPKGQRLMAAVGETRAVWIWRAFLLLGVVFGVCLATGQINPMIWKQ